MRARARAWLELDVLFVFAAIFNLTRTIRKKNRFTETRFFKNIFFKQNLFKYQICINRTEVYVSNFAVG